MRRSTVPWFPGKRRVHRTCPVELTFVIPARPGEYKVGAVSVYDTYQSPAASAAVASLEYPGKLTPQRIWPAGFKQMRWMLVWLGPLPSAASRPCPSLSSWLNQGPAGSHVD